MHNAHHILFVYGTLRQGLYNNHYLHTAEALGTATTRDLYTLYQGAYPYVAKSPAQCPIRGELFRVDNDTLKAVDILEEHPTVYCREQIEVLAESGDSLWAWIYFHPAPEGRIITSGDILAP